MYKNEAILLNPRGYREAAGVGLVATLNQEKMTRQRTHGEQRVGGETARAVVKCT